MNQDDYNISEHLPESIKAENVEQIAASIDEVLRNVAPQRTLVYPSIDILPENVLDTLGEQFHVDGYDSAWPVDAKRQQIKRSIMQHKRKGTPYAVKMATKGLVEDVEIKEWFEYGGEPYHFKVNVTPTRDEIDYLKFLQKAILDSKNVRSWLEELRATIQEYPRVTEFAVSNIFDSETITEEQKKIQNGEQPLYVGIAASITKFTTVTAAEYAGKEDVRRYMYGTVSQIDKEEITQ